MTTEELKQKVEDIVKEYLEEKGSPADNTKPADKKNKSDFLPKKVRDKINKEEGYEDPTPEEVDEGSCGKKDDDVRDTYDDEVVKRNKKTFKDSLSESKEVIKETPKQEIAEAKETNEDWYWGSLYSKLKDKWTK